MNVLCVRYPRLVWPTVYLGGQSPFLPMSTPTARLLLPLQMLPALLPVAPFFCYHLRITTRLLAGGANRKGFKHRPGEPNKSKMRVSETPPARPNTSELEGVSHARRPFHPAVLRILPEV